MDDDDDDEEEEDDNDDKSDREGFVVSAATIFFEVPEEEEEDRIERTTVFVASNVWHFDSRSTSCTTARVSISRHVVDGLICSCCKIDTGERIERINARRSCGDDNVGGESTIVASRISYNVGTRTEGGGGGGGGGDGDEGVLMDSFNSAAIASSDKLSLRGRDRASHLCAMV